MGTKKGAAISKQIDKNSRQKGTPVTSVEPKRQASMTMGGRSSLKDFQAWMRQAGISWDKSLIQMRAGSTDGALDEPDAPWAVYAVSDVPEGRVLATVPRWAVLSAPNSGLADVLAAERLGGGLALVAGVMYEAARGRSSKWYGYLSSLPPREYLPVFWSDAQLAQLAGTDIAHKAAQDRAAMRSDFEQHLAPLAAKYPRRLGPLVEHGWSLEGFMRAASWVASRAFFVDEHHGDALVPLADVFNHKAARVELRSGGSWADGFVVAEHAAAQQQHRGSKRRRGEPEDGEDGEEEEEEEASESGAESSGSGEGEEDGESEEGEDDEEESEGGHGTRRRRNGGAGAGVDPTTLDREPGDDNDGAAGPWPPPPPPPPEQQGHEGGQGQQQGGQAGAQGVGRWDQLKAAAAARGGNLHLDIGICAVERGDAELLDIVAAQPLAAGREVYNTYGEHGNAELVNKYGFALPNNSFDELLLDKGALVAAAEAQLGRKAAQRRTKFLKQHSELLSEDEEPLLLLPPAHVSTALWVALRVLAAGDKQLAAWGGIEDVLVPLREHWKQQQQQAAGQGEAEGAVADGSRGAKRQRGTAEDGEGEGAEEKAAVKRSKGRGNGGGEAGEAQEGDGEGHEGGKACGPGCGHHHHHPHDHKKGGKAREEEQEEEESEGEGDEGEEEEEEEDSDGDDEDDLPEDVEIEQCVVGAGAKEGKKKGKGGAAGAGTGMGGLWAEAMGALLLRVVEQRLGAYPTTLQQDEGALAEQQEQQQGEKGKAATGAEAVAAAEAEAARRCALVLRLGEKQLLAAVRERLTGGKGL